MSDELPELTPDDVAALEDLSPGHFLGLVAAPSGDAEVKNQFSRTLVAYLAHDACHKAVLDQDNTKLRQELDFVETSIRNYVEPYGFDFSDPTVLAVMAMCFTMSAENCSLPSENFTGAPPVRNFLSAMGAFLEWRVGIPKPEYDVGVEIPDDCEMESGQDRASFAMWAAVLFRKAGVASPAGLPNWGLEFTSVCEDPASKCYVERHHDTAETPTEEE